MQEIGLPKSYSKRDFTGSFKVDPELWSRFKTECRIRVQGDPQHGDVQGGAQSAYLRSLNGNHWTLLKRGVSICHVLEALMEAWIQGQKATATVVKPVVVNLTMQHVVKRPRRIAPRGKPWAVAQSKTWPPSCEHADDFHRSTKAVGCLELKDWISLEKCWRCYLSKQGVTT